MYILNSVFDLILKPFYNFTLVIKNKGISTYEVYTRPLVELNYLTEIR